MTSVSLNSQCAPQCGERFDEAFLLASRLHRKQTRKGSGTPYIAHLMAVCSLVLEAGGTEDQAIAALLHDAVEDQGGAPTLVKIRAKFGNDVAEIVVGCTDAYEEPKPPWRERKEDFLARVPTMPYEVRLVMTADKLHNVRSVLADYRQLKEELWSRFTGNKDGTLWYYSTITDQLIARLGPDEVQLQAMTGELQRTVTGLTQMAREPSSPTCLNGEGT